MGLSPKKKRENCFLEAFLAQEPHKWELGEKDREQPDFILRREDRRDDRKIGVEVTEFYLREGDHSEQVQRKRRQKVIESARHAYASSGLVNCAVYVGFDPTVSLEQRRRPRMQELPQLLADVVRTNEGNGAGAVPWERYREVLPEVRFLYLEPRYPLWKDWRVLQVGLTRCSEESGIKDIVRKKEKLARNYERCNALWLLICVDCSDPAQQQEIRVDGLSIETKIFDRVILFAHPFGWCVDVATRGKS